jgi:hypothetical protein
MQFSTKRPRAIAVLATGCIVGVLDGAAAVANAWFRSGTPPDRVFKYIASAIFGSAAFSGGAEMVATGIFLHFLVAIIWTMIFTVAYPAFPLARRNKWLVGCGYGLLVWLIMNRVVVPLTQAPPLKFSWEGAAMGWLIHMLLVGIPIVWLVRRWYAVTVKFP